MLGESNDGDRWMMFIQTDGWAKSWVKLKLEAWNMADVEEFGQRNSNMT